MSTEDGAAEHGAVCRDSNCPDCPDPEAIHGWFGLTHANYLVIPRSHLQSMPNRWQSQFVGLLQEWSDIASKNGWDSADRYRVQAVDGSGKFTKDTAPHYNRGRTRLSVADSAQDGA